MEARYYNLESVAAKLNLPQRFIKEQADQKRIPFLKVGGRLRFNPAAVQNALDRLAAEQQIRGARK